VKLHKAQEWVKAGFKYTVEAITGNSKALTRKLSEPFSQAWWSRRKLELM
jgi:hypothetical protein